MIIMVIGWGLWPGNGDILKTHPNDDTDGDEDDPFVLIFLSKLFSRLLCECSKRSKPCSV